jgi:hypothetical protein
MAYLLRSPSLSECGSIGIVPDKEAGSIAFSLRWPGARQVRQW